MRKRTSHSCPSKLTSTFIKRQQWVWAFDQIAGEMYVICTLRGEVTYKPTLQAQ
jgi:hypothetical protein